MYKITFITLLVTAALTVSGQNTQDKALFSGADFLTIAPNARAGAMGAQGVATAPDVYSIYWNAAKAVFNESRMEASFTYSPWMREIADDINLSTVGFFRKIDDRQAVSAGFRYFSFGEIAFTNDEGISAGDHKPYEMSLDIAYSRKLGKNLSAAVTLKYIRSQLGLGQMVSGVELEAANAFAADISVFYNKPFTLGSKKAVGRVGLNLANIGSKLKYGDHSTEAYLPGDLRLGGSVQTDIATRHSLMLSVEANSRMIPRREKEEAPDKSGVGGYFSSFGDIRSDNLFFAVGAEYWYAQTLAARIGYHYGNEDSGKPTYFSAGVGIQYFNILADFSYIAAISDENPLRNSIQFSVGVNLDFFRKSK